MKRYTPIKLQEQDEEELHPRVLEILDCFKNEDFNNFSKRLDFASKLLEIIVLSKDVRIRRLIKKICQAIKEIEEE
jgi:hypothetical protein